MNFLGKMVGGPRVVVVAAFHARVRGSVPVLGGLKETEMFLPHPRVKNSIVGSLRDREVACSALDRQGSNVESCVWRTVSSQSSHHPQEVLLAQFSLYVHKGFISWKDCHTPLHCLPWSSLPNPVTCVIIKTYGGLPWIGSTHRHTRIIPANTRRWTNVGLMLGQRRRRRVNIKPTLVQPLVLVLSGSPLLRLLSRDNYLVTAQRWPSVWDIGPAQGVSTSARLLQ